MTRIKAGTFLETLEFVKLVGGPEAPAMVLGALGGADQELFRRPPTVEDWLEYGAFMRYLLALDRVLGKGDLALVREATMFVARRDLNALAKVLLTLATPKLVANSIPRIWRQYWDEGVLKMTWTGPKSGFISLSHFSDMPLHHEVANNAFIEELLRLAGCRQIRLAHPACLARGDDHCRFELQWE